MLRLVLGLSLTFACSAANVSTFYSESAFDDAIGSGSFTTESFSGNQINTPGLTISACRATSYPTNFTPVCSQLSTSQLNEGMHYFQFITQNIFTDAVGRNPVNPYSGNFGVNDFTTIFTLPESVTAVGFDVNETPDGNLGSNFGIDLGGETVLYPFGGFLEDFPNLPASGYSYDGFVGFTSETPFDSVDFSAFYNPGVAYTLDNLTFGDPVPEPSTIPYVGFGLLGVGLILRKLRST